MKFDLTILGSSSAIPLYNRALSGQVLNLNERLFLIDCGDGTQIQIKRYKIKYQRINHIFISHLHGDHFYGLIGLLSTMQLFGRSAGLIIHGPENLEKIIRIQLELTATGLSYPLEFNILQPNESQLLVDGIDYTVDSFPVKHSVPTWGFVFKEKIAVRNIIKSFVEEHNIPIGEFEKIKKGNDFIDIDGKVYPNKEITIDPPKPRSFAYCSDTIYNENILPFIEKVDLLYHEATFGEDKRKVAEEKLHSTARDAALIALKAGVKKLIIGHFSARYKSLQILLKEAREIFPETYLAEDGEIFRIERS